MMIRTVIQRIVLVSLVCVLFCGCVGVRTYELSGQSNEISSGELARALIGKSASITFVDGIVYEGWIRQVQDDSVTICLEEPPDTVVVRSGNIYAISVSGCASCRTAGAVFGGLIGVAAGGTKRMDHSSNLSFQMNYDPILYGVVGSTIGGTIVGIVTPPKRYLFGQAPALLDTLRVEKKDVISDTSERTTIRQGEKLITYDKRLVKIDTYRDHVLLIRPIGKGNAK